MAWAGLASSPVAAAGPAPARGATEHIVQFDAGIGAAERQIAVRAAGGVVIRDLHLIQGLGIRADAKSAAALARMPGVRAVTPNAAVSSAAEGSPGPANAAPAGGAPGAAQGAGSAKAPGAERRRTPWNPTLLATAFNQSTRADKVWAQETGGGVAVAVIDSGIDGDHPDFRRSATDPTSRVIASVVTNAEATTATDRYGHGTHVAGLIAGDSRLLDPADPAYGRYVGSAPSANLVSVKVSDDAGNAYVMDVIAGLQFVVDHGAAYGIRVVNLSLGSSQALPYRLDPLDAAVEAVWAHGFVVVAAAGNRGSAEDAVSYAPANDPFIITVGAVDDHGTKDTTDDTVAPWSSRGRTQDGFAKPDLLAPGAHIVAPLASGSAFADMCSKCVVDQRYFQIGGTSMAAPIVAGIAANMVAEHPEWTPDDVKGALTYVDDVADASGQLSTNLRRTADGGWEAAADRAIRASEDELAANAGLEYSWFLDPVTGAVDDSRASWKRASWRMAVDGLRASWRAESWICGCVDDKVVAEAARAHWGRASWRTFFGENPSEHGELRGGRTGAPGAASNGNAAAAGRPK